MPNKNTPITIASVGVSPLPVNVTIISVERPTVRQNGGDLVNGDRWFEPTTRVESIYLDSTWISLQSPT